MRPVFGQTLHTQAAHCRVDLVGGALAITSPYDAGFVAALKATIPGSDRKWDGSSKRWMVSVDYGSQLQQLVSQHYGVTVSLPDLHSAPQTSEMRILDVRYLGACKSRDDGTETAYGWVGGQWAAIFPKAALLEWFGQTSRPDEAQTLYGVLGVSQNVDAAGLKSAWKRLARQWHTDVCKEPGAKEQFQAIQEAYQILSDTVKRGKYDAGLQFEALSRAHSPHSDRVVMRSEWRSPLRCGLILVEGQSRLGRFVVSKIMQWNDIVNERGEILVTSWAAGDDHFTETWTP